MSELPREVLAWLEKHALRYANVWGYSRTFKKKIIKGKTTDIDAIRFYVYPKLPLKALRSEDVIPKEVKGVPTDVVQREKPKAFSAKTELTRPVKMGISVAGRYVGAATNSWVFEHSAWGEVIGHVAHGLTHDPFRPPEAVRERRILQPSPLHVDDPADLRYVVGELLWYERLRPVGFPSDCRVASTIATLYNKAAELLRLKTRIIPITIEANHMDFGVYRPTKPHTPKFPTIDAEDAKIVGILFAGSRDTAILFRIKYAVEAGFKPIDTEPHEPDLLDEVYGESYYCHYKTRIIDDSTNLTVSYDGRDAPFEDAILLDNNGTVKGGWSGTSFWFRERG